MQKSLHYQENKINFKLINKKNIYGKNISKNYKWTIRNKKSLEKVHEQGDLIFVKRDNDIWLIKQYQKLTVG